LPDVPAASNQTKTLKTIWRTYKEAHTPKVIIKSTTMRKRIVRVKFALLMLNIFLIPFIIISYNKSIKPIPYSLTKRKIKASMPPIAIFFHFFSSYAEVRESPQMTQINTNFGDSFYAEEEETPQMTQINADFGDSF
jgi:hypothetical protein